MRPDGSHGMLFMPWACSGFGPAKAKSHRSTSLTVRLSLTALSKVEWAALSLSKGGTQNVPGCRLLNRLQYIGRVGSRSAAVGAAWKPALVK